MPNKKTAKTSKTTKSARSASGQQRLYLSKDKMLAGVCGGIAEYMGTDPTIIRLAWVLLTILSGIVPGIIAYIVAAIVIPERPKR